MKRVAKAPARTPRTRKALRADAAATVDALMRKSSKKWRDSLVRYAIPTDNALGVPMKEIQAIGKRLRPDHELAGALWETGIYEARLLVAYVADPALITVAQMNAWCRDFDNWAVVDTLCLALFSRSPHAWGRINAWAKRKPEFERRAAFALLAGMARRSVIEDDGIYLRHLPLIESCASDERNFVKKGVNWALRMIGRRNKNLNGVSAAVAARLSRFDSAAARWVGRDAHRELTSVAVLSRLRS